MQLFHYTNQAGLLGILESKSLWATKIQFLNDRQELNLTLDLAKSILQQRGESSKGEKQKFQLSRLRNNLKNIRNTNICACSFTENGDLLSQWRGYGNSAGGYSLGFEFEKLKQCFIAAGFKIEKCIYDENEQKAKISSLIDEVLSEYSFENEKNIEHLGVTSPSARALLKLLAEVAPVIKHHAFFEEQEWRAFTPSGINHTQLSYRSGDSFLVPFVPVVLGDGFFSALNDIVVGPNPDGYRAAAAIANMLWSKGSHPIRYEPEGKQIYDADNGQGVDITLSKIPFRNW